MRWFVEVATLSSGGAPARVTVEAPSWQGALAQARSGRGDGSPLSSFTIEVLAEGYRATNAGAKLRYVVSKAPDDAPLTKDQKKEAEEEKEKDGKDAPSASAPAPAPAAAAASAPQPPPKAMQKTMMGMSASMLGAQEASTSTSAARPAPVQAPQPSRPTPTVGTPHTPGSAPVAEPAKAEAPKPEAPKPEAPKIEAPKPEGRIFFRRTEDPGPKSPITYRELAVVVASGTSFDRASSIARAHLDEIKRELDAAKAPAGRLVHLGIFDHEWTHRPKTPAIAALTWKDWRGDAEVKVGTKPPAPAPQPTPAVVVAPTPAPAAIAPAPAVAPAPVAAPAPVMASPAVVAAPAAAPAPVVAPAPAAAAGAATGAAPASASAPGPTPASASPSAPTPAPAFPSAPGPAPATAPAFAPAPAPSAAAAPAPNPLAQTAIALAPAAAAASAKPLPTTQVDLAIPIDVAAPAAAPPKPALEPSAPAPVAPGPDKQSVRPPRAGRPEDLMTEIFESMHDLHFLRDSLEGADFVLDLIRDKIPTKVSLVHLYDINAKQFVVVKGRAPSVAILGARTPEGTALIGAAVKSGRGVLIADASKDDRWSRERYELTGVVPTSICIAPVRQGQRFLGALEIADHHDGQPLGEAELHALTYIAEQYGEFVADRGVKLVTTDSGGYQQLDVGPKR